jgi:hypothetical protein
MYQIDELPTELFIGKQGESKINDIQIDCAAWLSEYPGSTMAATFIRPGYRDPVVLPVEMDGTTMVVPVRHNVSRYDGVGSLNIQL